MKARRCILFLDPRFPVEREVSATIEAAEAGDRAALLRALLLIGYREVSKDRDTKAADAGKESQNEAQAT